MAVTLQQVPTERITAQAREVRFWRTVLTVIAGALFGGGWLAAKLLGAAWLALAWTVIAVREGWRSGRGTKVTRGPARAG